MSVVEENVAFIKFRPVDAQESQVKSRGLLNAERFGKNELVRALT